MKYQEFCDSLELEKNVSRETFSRLELLHNLLAKWNAKINLIAAKDSEHIWRRHILDSAQLAKYIPQNNFIIDFGSGAGFPGLVLSIMGYRVSLVDSDAKKCAFLTEAARATGCSPSILNQRIESLDNDVYDVVTSRACAPLDKLLELSQRFLMKNSFCLFMKGKDYKKEEGEAEKHFSFASEYRQSITNKDGVIIKLWDMRKIT